MQFIKTAETYQNADCISDEWNYRITGSSEYTYGNEPEDVGKGTAVISYGDLQWKCETALPFDAVNESQMYQ